MPDVNNPSTWPGALQRAWWARSGPAAAVPRTAWKNPIFGRTITWLDPSVKAYWAQVVGDTSIAQPTPQDPWRMPQEPWPVPHPGPLGPGDDRGAARYCPTCGRPAQAGANFCAYDGTRL